MLSAINAQAYSWDSDVQEKSYRMEMRRTQFEISLITQTTADTLRIGTAEPQHDAGRDGGRQ